MHFPKGKAVYKTDSYIVFNIHYDYYDSVHCYDVRVSGLWNDCTGMVS